MYEGFMHHLKPAISMLWIITSPQRVHEEERLITGLLEAGAARVLLRKPGWSSAEYRRLIDKIGCGYYNRLLIRDQPLLAAAYGLAGVHWSGQGNAAPQPGFINSKGIHSTAGITLTDKRFCTLLLSPVFNSISKPGYAGRFNAPVTNKQNRQVLALGGVNHANIAQVKQWNFDGAALLGAIWETPAKAVENYYRIQELWNRNDLT
jgi:thiamine-phosphate pyrophosphorylase